MWPINFRMQKDRSQTTPRLDQIPGWFEACVHIVSASCDKSTNCCRGKIAHLPYIMLFTTSNPSAYLQCSSIVIVTFPPRPSVFVGCRIGY